MSTKKKTKRTTKPKRSPAQIAATVKMLKAQQARLNSGKGKAIAARDAKRAKASDRQPTSAPKRKKKAKRKPPNKPTTNNGPSQRSTPTETAAKFW